MFFNFIKSISFHLLIIFSFLVFDSFYDFSRRNIVTEIPIEVVDVSEKTKVKKKKLEKKVEKKVEQRFTPPKPISKPNPPEFEEKDKNVKVKVEKKKEIIKEEKKENRLSSILKSIEKVTKNNKIKKDDKIEEKQKDITQSSNFDEKITISEKDLIRRQFAACWNPPSGSKNIDKLKVLVKLTLDENGNVMDAKLVNNGNMNDPFYRSAAERAMRAVRHSACKKIKVPSKKFQTWKNMTLNFDPIIMQGLK